MSESSARRELRLRKANWYKNYVIIWLEVLRTQYRMLSGLKICLLSSDKVDPLFPLFHRLWPGIAMKRYRVHKNASFWICSVAAICSNTMVWHSQTGNHTLCFSLLQKAFPSWRHRPNSGPFFLNSAVNQNGANFANFKNSQKIKYKS